MARPPAGRAGQLSPAGDAGFRRFRLEIARSAEPVPRLALCSVGELFGGVERHVLGLCRYRRREGLDDPLLVLFREGELARQAREEGFEPVVLAGGRWNPRLADRLAGLLRERGTEVLHVHGYKAVVLGALAARRGGFALVKTEHGRHEPTTRPSLTGLRGRGYRLLETLATRAAVDVACYVTEDLRRHYARAHGTVPARVVPNGIDPPRRQDTRRPEALRPGRRHAVMVGRVTAVKGMDLALAALANESLPPDLDLVVAGEGPLLPRLRRRVAALGLEGRVAFLGFRHDVHDLVAHADLLLMPSRHEGLPYALLEAMALETPVVASRVGGLAEVLRDGRTGLLVPPGDVPALRTACRRLLKDPGLARSLGRAAREEVLRRYTLEAMGSRYEEIYRSAVQARFGAVANPFRRREKP